MGSKKTAADAATQTAEVPAAPAAKPQPDLKLTRALRFGAKRFGKEEKITPAAVGLNADQVEWLISSKSAVVVESEGGEA